MEDKPSRPWRVFVTYLVAVAAILATTVTAMEILRSAYPDVPELALVRTLPGLLGGSLAAATALILTLLLIVRPLDPVRLRLLPGVETGPVLAVMIVGLLALGQALDSGSALLGFGDDGTLKLIRQVLEQTRGPELFAAVLVFGLSAGVAEEIFFRGYMQARLREHWSAPAAVLASSSTFAVLHLDTSPVHMVLVFALGLYLGFVAEITGSTLPSIVCHVINNVVYTLQTALGFAVLGRDANVLAAAACALVFVACMLWLRRAVPPTATT
ncbi:MAG TPA: CPBP family intramembrane glutamic endopeptidase [Methylomirabilota bacterium]|jgi:membrane protease YdiL (CAAX protease family)|nr:CPBP family intramembrane glutamic endopeptidase [Methylomirabilota bacterium]